MKSPSVKRNFLFNLIYQIFVFITPIVTTPYVSRVLSADGIGEYSYSVSIVTYFSLFGTFGLSTYGQLEIAKNRYECAFSFQFLPPPLLQPGTVGDKGSRKRNAQAMP